MLPMVSWRGSVGCCLVACSTGGSEVLALLSMISEIKSSFDNDGRLTGLSEGLAYMFSLVRYKLKGLKVCSSEK